MKRAKRIDPWIMVSVVILALYLLFLIYPMFNVLGRSVVEDGKLTLKYFITFFSQEYYISTLWNSFKVSIATTAVSLNGEEANHINVGGVPDQIQQFITGVVHRCSPFRP